MERLDYKRNLDFTHYTCLMAFYNIIAWRIDDADSRSCHEFVSRTMHLYGAMCVNNI